MRKKIVYMILIVGLALIAVGGILFLLRGFNGGEDNWIKDSSGVWIKHGNPSAIPENVKEQQDAIVCAGKLYQLVKSDGMELKSQCLGGCGNYSIDIVNIPRNAEDDKVENQCKDFADKKIPNFIELDKNGVIVRVVESG